MSERGFGKRLFKDNEYGWNEIEEGILRVKSRVTIGVMGIGKGAGKTFTAVNLAGILSQKYEGEVCYVPENNGCPESMGVLKSKRTFNKRLMIVDNPKDYRKMDLRIVVVDPLPSRIKENIQIYRELRQVEKEGLSFIWLLNKDNSGVDRRELERFLKKEFSYVQDMISSEVIYENEYSRNNLFNRVRLLGLEIIADELMGQYIL